jgi:hypothetical protein
MNRVNLNSIFVFKEQSHLFGILPTDFNTFLPLNKLWIAPVSNDSPLWKFEGTPSNQQGYFVHLATLFGFKDVRFSQSGVVFLKQHAKNMFVGIVMNDFVMQIVNRNIGPKTIAMELTKNFPPNLPKSAFHFIQRYKRKNIMVINPEGLMKEYKIEWPETKR